MIRLDVQSYCEECLDFEADVYKAEVYSSGSGNHRSDTLVRCKHRKRCESIRKFLEQKMRGEMYV